MNLRSVSPLLLLLLLPDFWSMAQFRPVQRYLADASSLAAGETVAGPSRVLDLKGRKGINTQSIHATIHRLAAP